MSRLSTYMFASAALLALATPASALTVSVDLSSAVTGTTIVAPGASFAQTFAGQTVIGTGISGSPTDPLSLVPGGSLVVENFNPIVSPAGNSIRPQPGNTAPLAILLDDVATSITWTMGSFGGGAVTVQFYETDGDVLATTTTFAPTGYQVFTFSGFGTFAGISIRDNTDEGGLRYMNFSYDVAEQTATPEPASLALLAAGCAALAVCRRKGA